MGDNREDPKTLENGNLDMKNVNVKLDDLNGEIPVKPGLPSVDISTIDQQLKDDVKDTESNPPVDESGAEENHFTKGAMYLNMAILSIGMMCTFIPFMALQNLQSTLNSHQGGIGRVVLSVGYFCTIFSTALAPLQIRILGNKGVLVASAFGTMLYTASNFFPYYYVMIPVILLTGFLGAGGFLIKDIYATTFATRLQRDTGKENVHMASSFQSIVFFFISSGKIIGDFISSGVLGIQPADTTLRNSTIDRKCGARFCPLDQNLTSDPRNRPPLERIHLLLIIFLCISAVGCISVFLFLKPLFKKPPEQDNVTCKDVVMKLTSVIRMLKDYKYVMFMPIFLFWGFKNALIYGDFTQSIVSCELGVGWVGYTMLTVGVSNCVLVLPVGILAKYVPRPFLMGIAFTIYMACYLTMLLWKPSANQLAVFFIIPFSWGCADSIMQTQLTPMVGQLFNNNMAAFAGIPLFLGIGGGVSFAISAALCMGTKVYINIGVLILAIVCYSSAEILATCAFSQSVNLDHNTESNDKDHKGLQRKESFQYLNLAYIDT
ncbi:unnamed protein product [Owenia fusiformis]|uniref:Uncharacterized protein n=1 Tax=Owenia fusiformis TaxID=6347 RepID=A0A8J1TC28_OWEFU|nr:unnamed protein product [Owenia fusiformis]